MLHQQYPPDTLARQLLPRADYHPHPTLADRDDWQSLPDSVRHAHIIQGEALLGFDYPSLPAALFLEFQRIGNRENYQRLCFRRRGALVSLILAECIENEGRFLDDIVNGVWTICEETYWGVPAHVNRQQAGVGLPDVDEPTVDLFAAETSNLLAWAHYLLGERLDSVSPLVRPRIEAEIDRRVLTPLLERDDFSWMGFRLPPAGSHGGRRVNNWNPWICSNWLASTLLIERDEARRQRSVAKAMRTVDNFIDPYPRDGGCDEGPSYWDRAGASLFDCLALLHGATEGAIDVYDEPLVGEIGRFIYRAHIGGDAYINFADAPAYVYPDGPLIFRYGQRIDDPAMVDFDTWLVQRGDLRERGYTTHSHTVALNLQRALRGLFALDDIPIDSAQPPLPHDVWLPDIEVAVARDVGSSTSGYFVAAKGGTNNESHNHNDIGTFVIYVDGKPVIVDAGVETYTAKTFSATRYEIWTMVSGYHSLLPTVDGVQQAPGASYRATDASHAANDERALFQLDLASAYPPEAKIDTWQRSVALHRGQKVVVEDEYRLGDVAGKITMSVVTPCAVDVETAGMIRFGEREFLEGRTSGSGTLSYDGDRFHATTERIAISDARMGGTWGEYLTRVVLTAKEPPQRESLRFVFEL